MQGLYSIARSAGAVMFESNVHCQYVFPNGSGLVTDTLFGLKKIPDSVTVTQDSVAMGFDCGAPPEPRVVCASLPCQIYLPAIFSSIKDLTT